MATAFDREALLDAFDRIGVAAALAKTRLQIAVYGGSAKSESKLGMICSVNRKATFRDHALLASDFRFATEDVDIADIGGDWPDWLGDEVANIARRNGWSEDWFNDAVTFHLSPLAEKASDHLEFGTFPRDSSEPGLIVNVPSTRYLLALKLKAIRVLDQKKGDAERLDPIDLMRAANVTTTKDARYARLKNEPVLTMDDELDAFAGGIAEYTSKQRKLGRVPDWASHPRRRLHQPHFIPDVAGFAMREYLTFASPAEFASRNIFTEARPLRRARGPAVGKPDIA